RRGVFLQAVGLELPPRELAPDEVPLARVDRPDPALKLPRGRAEVDAPIGKGVQPRRQPRGLQGKLRREQEALSHGARSPGPEAYTHRMYTSKASRVQPSTGPQGQGWARRGWVDRMGEG